MAYLERLEGGEIGSQDVSMHDEHDESGIFVDVVHQHAGDVGSNRPDSTSTE